MKKIISVLIFSFAILCIIAFSFVVNIKNKEIDSLKQAIAQQKETIIQLEKTNANKLSEEEKIVQECMKKENYTTIGMTNCVNESMDRWNKKIDSSIISLKKVLSADDYKLLEKSQQKWREYKDSQWAFLDSFYSKQVGTIYSNILSAYKAELLKQRAQELDGLYFE